MDVEEKMIRTGSTVRTVAPAKAADLDEFKATPYYQGLGIERLQEQAAGFNVDDDVLRQQAEAEYSPGYQTELESVRQQLEKEVQGLNGRKSGIEAAYDRQRRQVDESYDESAVGLENELNRRGLGRSSLVSAQGAYLEKQRNQELSDIGRDENAAISAINDRIALLTSQAAQNERTLSANYARQLQDRVNELKQENRNASISLQLQIAALQQQGYEAYQEWLLKNRAQELDEKKYEAEYGVGEPEEILGGSSSGGSSGAAKKAAKKQESKPVSLGNVVTVKEAPIKEEKKARAATALLKKATASNTAAAKTVLGSALSGLTTKKSAAMIAGQKSGVLDRLKQLKKR